ncbi:MAG: hypothetical protein KJ955_00130 [Nanoarchaeota archaeon]|nr:hypothetical protein [Nanoarchaeota archaeon]
MKAAIQNAKIRSIDAIWKKHKPQGIGFSDTDAVILNLKTEDGKIFSETFYCRLKADGTLGHSITRASEKRQNELRKFIGKYFSKDKRYNVRDNIDKWKGKEVLVEELDKSYAIAVK